MAERFFWRFPSDDAVITASTSALRYPVANLLDSRLTGVVWRSGTSQASEYIELDLGAEYTVDSFAALAHTLTASYSGLRLTGDVTYPLPGSPTLDVTPTFRTGRLVEYFTPKTVRYLKFAFTKTTAATVAEIARLLIGESYTMERSSANRTWKKMSLSNIVTPRTGQVYTDPGAKPKGLSLVYNAIKQNDMEALMEIADYALDAPILMSVDHENEPVEWSIYGICTKDPDFKQLVARNANSDIEFDGNLEISETL